MRWEYPIWAKRSDRETRKRATLPSGEADLIRNQREGKFIYYELNTSVLEDVMLWITDLKGASNDEGNDKKI